MSGDSSDEDRLPAERTPDDPAPPLEAEIVVAGDSPAKCTLFPADATELERLHIYVSAEEGSFVSLDDVR
jgi:hypothetical protein